MKIAFYCRVDGQGFGFVRFLAKVGDNGMKMQIVRIGFGGKL